MARRTRQPTQLDIEREAAIGSAREAAAEIGHELVPCPVGPDDGERLRFRCRLCGRHFWLTKATWKRSGLAFSEACAVRPIIERHKRDCRVGSDVPGSRWSGYWNPETGDVDLLILHAGPWRRYWHIVGGPHPNGVYIPGRFYKLLCHYIGLDQVDFAASDSVAELVQLAEDWEDALAHELAKPRIVLPAPLPVDPNADLPLFAEVAGR
ncbi:hypothetical protein SAMN06265365_14824 [Tistlia consotensis]|uniref:Uncharacterized protein n=1 Tax=Tistlia consotensis USBA 355 TaxID=560819 RepID=A0A1Y6CQ78_9PROT|nr:hypothetical protein [Tistlia consotensis]SMF82951.1 hypothetical protein SAMN05428998_14825 [Tistlia consotensis USBA 355]SNS31480.1 hypothetical protein SAMN06265365_14824 [Tistlia consotensis]